MRIFTDEQGRAWDVVAGRESWGSMVALFIPRGGGAGAPNDESRVVRQAPFQSSGYEKGNRELVQCSDQDLQELLDRSVPKETG